MSGILSIAVIQANLFWEDIAANLHFFEQEIIRLPDSVDLVVLPETFTTGFTMNTTQFADDKNLTLNWMKELSARKGLAIAGSAIIKEKENYFNRLLFVDRGSLIDQYDKRHLFRMGREQEFFTRGERRVIVRLGKFRILLQICYDLRFPVFARNRGDYDAILYVANWPSKREYVWDKLLIARAIENQAFVIGANRCGTDGEGEGTCGNSCLIDPKGKIIARLKDQAGNLMSSIEISDLESFRQHFPVLKDADNFKIL
jgi:predicted amidohydrolase